MSPQRSNRAQLIEGTLRCLERLPPARVTARVIAEESGANLASITYHFGSKDNLVTEAVIEGLDRWLVEVASTLDAELGRSTDQDTPGPGTPGPGPAGTDPAVRFRRAAAAVAASRERHLGLARNFVRAIATAQHDSRIRELLADGFRHSRPDVATLLSLGDDETGHDAAGLVLSMFHGLLLQILLDPALAIDGIRLERAQARLGRIFPGT